MNNQDTTISSFFTTKQLPVEKIFHCLVPCADCTGSYVSEILGMRFICCCHCHMKSKDLVALTHTVKVGRNNRQAVTRYFNEVDKEEEQKRLQGAHGVQPRPLGEENFMPIRMTTPTIKQEIASLNGNYSR